MKGLGLGKQKNGRVLTDMVYIIQVVWDMFIWSVLFSGILYYNMNHVHDL